MNLVLDDRFFKSLAPNVFTFYSHWNTGFNNALISAYTQPAWYEECVKL